MKLPLLSGKRGLVRQAKMSFYKNNEEVFKMSSIERTAYPRFATGRVLKERELEQFYSLTPDELNYIYKNIRATEMQLNFAVQLKTFQRLGYFPALKSVPRVVIEHIKKCLAIFDDGITFYYKHDTTL